MSKGKRKSRRFDKALRQAAPAEPKATRRMSDSRLMALLDPHMLESISEIAHAYQLLVSSLGYRKANFQPRVVQTTPDPSKKMNLALDCAALIADWRKTCLTWDMDSRGVICVVADGCSVSGVMRETGWTREHTKHQLRGCLTVWSLSKQRVQVIEVRKHRQAILDSKPSK